MDANVSLIPIQHEFKFSEQILKRLSTKDPESPIPLECYTELTDIKEVPDVKYRMALNIITKNDVSYFSPVFVLFNLNDRRIRGTFAFYIKSANYTPPFGCALFEYKSSFYGPTVCTVEDFFNPEKKFIVNDELCMEFKGIFYLESSNEKCEPKQTLGQYLWNRDDHDFTILVGKENDSKTEIKVHKIVLAARSSVFDAMLQTNMKEKAENKVQITDFDAKIVQAAVEYCYDQSTPFSNIIDDTILLQIADKYDIKDLKNQLEEHFAAIAVPEFICQIANASIISNSPKLRDFCIKKMLIFSKMDISIENIEILDKDIAFEFVQKTFSFKK